MFLALSLAFFILVAVALLVYLGYGLARLLLPAEWRYWDSVLAPLLGYVLLLLVGYYAVRTVLNLREALWVLLGVATVLNILALWRRRGPVLSPGLREHGPAWLLFLAAFVLAVLPLLSYGYSTPIGENWDPENYVPIAAYLYKVPVGQLDQMPPNPLRDLNAAPPRIGMSLGFCILLGILPDGMDPLARFAPTIALLYALAVLAWYAFFRRGMDLHRRAGLAAAFFAAFFALALWVALFNFGMQMAALPLVPLALLLWLQVLRRPGWQAALPAAAAVAALPVAYYPALTIFVPTALGLGLNEVLAARRRGCGPLLLAGGGPAALSAALAAGPILDYGAGFSFRYGQQMTTLGLFHFPPLAQVMGLEAFSRTPQALPAPWSYLVQTGLALTLLAACGVLWPSQANRRWIAVLIPGLLYLAWLWGMFFPLAGALQEIGLLDAGLAERFRPYPYAFLKGAVFVVPLIWGAAVETWERLRAWLSRGNRARAAGFVQAALLLLSAGLVLAADARLVSHYWGQPAHFDRQALEVRQAVMRIAPDAEVYLTGRPERSRVTLGLFAYFLHEHPVQGRLGTAYAGYDRRLPGAEPAYALLDAADDPHALGFFPHDQVWAGGGMVLYQRDPAVVSFRDLRADAYSGRPGAEVLTREPLAERLLQGFGRYPTIGSSDSGELWLDLTAGPGQPTLGGDYSLALALAALEPVTLTLRWSDGSEEPIALPAGFSVYRSPPHRFPAAAAIVAQPAAQVWPCWTAVTRPGAAPGVETWPAVALAWPEVTAAGATWEATLHLHNAGGRPLRLSLEVWENTFQDARHYAWWGPLPLSEQGTVRLHVDMAGRQVQAWVGGTEVAFPPHPGVDAWPEVADGSYFAALWVYYGAHVVEVLPLGQFQVAGGQVQEAQPLQVGPRLFWPRSLAAASGVRFGPAIALAGYEREERAVLPGGSLPVALEWQALGRVPVDYFVTVQVLRDGSLWGQWDGPAGQWYPASSWQAGQSVRDDIPLRIAKDAVPGRYRLIVAVYDPFTGARLPVRSADGQEQGDFLDLGEVVVRRPWW